MTREREEMEWRCRRWRGRWVGRRREEARVEWSVSEWKEVRVSEREQKREQQDRRMDFSKTLIPSEVPSS